MSQRFSNAEDWEAARTSAESIRDHVAQSAHDQPVRRSASGQRLDLRPLVVATPPKAYIRPLQT